MAECKDMPHYTGEQKARAFDLLWTNCGGGVGHFYDYVSRPDGLTSLRRVPRYVFEIVAEGEMAKFKDVLHYLATRSDAGAGNGVPRG